jgi:hypothetical protein
MQGKTDEPTSRTFGDGTVVVEGTRGVARMSRLAPGVLLFVCSGQLPGPYAPPMLAFAEREFKMLGKLVIATDAWALASVDTEFREAWTAWFQQHKQHFRMELLVRTKLMEMAAGLANLFTGLAVVKTHSKVEDWQQAVRRDVPGFRRSVPAA